MPPVVFEARDIIGNGEYLQEVRISEFRPTYTQPGGLRYSLCLVDLRTGDVVLLYDVHRGKSHHRHLRGIETPYLFRNAEKLLDDFLREVALIVEDKL